MWGVTRDVCRGTFLRRDGIGGIDAYVKGGVGGARMRIM